MSESLSHEQSSKKAAVVVQMDSDRTIAGALIVNADDWGRDRETTDRILDCVLARAVSSASAMVFMEDSERAAEIARERGVDTGIHLNFTSAFSGSGATARLQENQDRVARFLRGNRLAQVFYHPGLANPFQYVIAAQMDEYSRLYGCSPSRIDGHHHMHLCANVMFGEFLPEGTLVRRNFTFAPGEKSWFNRKYRDVLDRRLSRRHKLVDQLHNISPIEPLQRLKKVFNLAKEMVIELETHPVDPQEYDFLMTGKIREHLNGVEIAASFALPHAESSGRS